MISIIVDSFRPPKQLCPYTYFLRLELVLNTQSYSPSVIALILVHQNTVCIHTPVVVTGIEYVSSCQFYSKCFVKECFAHAHIHHKP